jgi:UDP-3-O-[3-hydroxymyristoyl] glucosamine N-acyltransferase
MNRTLGDICDFAGIPCDNDRDRLISKPGSIENASNSEITFMMNQSYEKQLYTSKAAAVVVPESFVPTHSVVPILLKVKKVKECFAKILLLFAPKEEHFGLSEKAQIDPSANIGNNVQIGPFVWIGENAVIEDNAHIYPFVFLGKGVTIGNASVIHSSVSIYQNSQIGNRCIIHANAVIGSDGFGYADTQKREMIKIPHVGNVVIEDDVEIGANTCIDRAVTGTTRIGKGTKLDNLIQVAHNVQIGNSVGMASQSGISGSTKVGARTRVGGQVGFADHLTISDDSYFAAKSGVMTSNQQPNIFAGAPTMPIKEFLRSAAIFKQLPEMTKEIKKLRKELDNLKSKK